MVLIEAVACNAHIVLLLDLIRYQLQHHVKDLHEGFLLWGDTLMSYWICMIRPHLKSWFGRGDPLLGPCCLGSYLNVHHVLSFYYIWVHGLFRYMSLLIGQIDSTMYLVSFHAYLCSPFCLLMYFTFICCGQLFICCNIIINLQFGLFSLFFLSSLCQL